MPPVSDARRLKEIEGELTALSERKAKLSAESALLQDRWWGLKNEIRQRAFQKSLKEAIPKAEALMAERPEGREAEEQFCVLFNDLANETEGADRAVFRVARVTEWVDEVIKLCCLREGHDMEVKMDGKRTQEIVEVFRQRHCPEQAKETS